MIAPGPTTSCATTIWSGWLHNDTRCLQEEGVPGPAPVPGRVSRNDAGKKASNSPPRSLLEGDSATVLLSPE